MFLQAFPVASQAATDFMKAMSTPAQPFTTAAHSKPGPTLVKVRAFFSTSKYNTTSYCNIWMLLDKPYVFPVSSYYSKASRSLPQRRAAVRRAKSPSPGWKSSSTTSMFPQTRSRRPVKHPWTRLMPDCCSNSSCSSSYRSLASSSSTTTTRLYYQHHLSTYITH